MVPGSCLLSPAGEGVEGTTFAVEFEHRSCNTLKRNEVVEAFAKAVPSPPHKVDLGAPKKTILVQLVRNVAGVAVVEDYKELLRMNVRKAVEEPEEAAAAAGQPQQKQQQEAEAEVKGEQEKAEGDALQQEEQNAEAAEATGE
jgi:tRNA acetyltransferase TAN1